MRSEETAGHAAQHEHTQTVVHQLSRAIGHLEAVRKMVESGRDCTEVLIQIAAVRGALNSISRVILKDHMQHCIVEAIANRDYAALEELDRAIDQMIR